MIRCRHIIWSKKDGLNTTTKIKYKLEEETKIQYFFDVIDYHTISSDELKEHIKKYGKVIYEKN